MSKPFEYFKCRPNLGYLTLTLAKFALDITKNKYLTANLAINQYYRKIINGRENIVCFCLLPINTVIDSP